MSINLFDLLSNGERIIVYSREDHSQVYTWNQSLTLECWNMIDEPLIEQSSAFTFFEEVSVRTLATEPRDYHAARAKAIEWCNSGVNDDR